MKRVVPLVTVLTLALAACGEGGGGGAGTGSTETAEGANAEAGAPAAAPAPAPGEPGGVPSVLMQAESAAEDIQDEIMVGQWSKATTQLDTLASLRQRLAGTGAGRNDLSSYAGALDSLRTAVQGKSRETALVMANRISRAVTGMMSRYPSRVPVEVGYMDVAARDVLYDAQQGRWQAAANAVAELQEQYSAVKQHVTESDPELDGRISDELVRLDNAVVAQDADRAQTLATAILEDVDLVEQTY